MKLIINADDCGSNREVDTAISRYIEMRKITSTTVMANMDDFEGAVQMYDKFRGNISFGVHLNLTQGSPLLYSQELLDKEYYKEYEGGALFNVNHMRQKIATHSVQQEFEKELCAQIEKVLDSGIKISHIDSHHHIHTSLLLIRLMPKLSKRYGINKMRRMRNYVPSASKLNIAMRNSWAKMIKLQNRAITMTDYFGSFMEWHKCGAPVLLDDVTMELMCHPGGRNNDTEESLMLSMDFSCMKGIQLISYNDL